jgi:hypothetical protein
VENLAKTMILVNEMENGGKEIKETGLLRDPDENSSCE